MSLLLINKFFASLVVLSDVFIVTGVIYYFFLKQPNDAVIDFFGKHGIKFAFLVALGATATTLFYSYGAGYAACDLCWYQRIFMYPQVILLGLAWWKGDKKIVDYAIPLAWFGAAFAVYHNYLYYGGTSLFPCNASTGGVSLCLKNYINEFGYVTIPVMSLTAFALLIGFLYLQKIYNRSHS